MRATILILVFLFQAFCAAAQPAWRWARTNSTPVIGSVEPTLLATDKKGNSFVSGYFQGDTLRLGSLRMANPRYGSYYPEQYFVFRTDSSGNYSWVTLFSAKPDAMATDSLGNLYIYGTYLGACTFGGITLSNPGGYMGALVKITAGGVFAWAKNIANIGWYNNSADIGLDEKENIYVTGSFTSATSTVDSMGLTNFDPSGTTSDIFVAKFKNNGHRVWAKNYGNTFTNSLLGFAVCDNGDFYLRAKNEHMIATGTTWIDSSYATLEKYDTAGNSLWSKQINDGPYVGPIAVDGRGNVYMCSTDKIGDFSSHETLMTISKYNTVGDNIWSQNIGVDAGGSALGISVDKCGSVWMIGTFSPISGGASYSVNFPAHVLNAPSGSFDPVFIARYDTAGFYISSIALPSGADDECVIKVDNTGSVLVLSNYMNTNMVFGSQTLPYAGFATEYLYLAKYKYLDEVCKTKNTSEVPVVPISGNDVSVFPNPANDQFQIVAQVPFSDEAKAIIYNMAGVTIGRYPLSGLSTTIHSGDLAPGLYELMICNGNNVPVVQKLSIVNR